MLTWFEFVLKQKGQNRTMRWNFGINTGQALSDELFGENEKLSIWNLVLRQKPENIAGLGFHPNES